MQLQPLGTRDAALLLLELCERPLDLDELIPAGGGSGGEEEVGPADLLGTLRRHELIFRLGGLPPSIQWAARRLKDVTVNELVDELRALKPREQARLVKQVRAMIRPVTDAIIRPVADAVIRPVTDAVIRPVTDAVIRSVAERCPSRRQHSGVGSPPRYSATCLAPFPPPGIQPHG